jgi:hypothetical protein
LRHLLKICQKFKKKENYCIFPYSLFYLAMNSKQTNEEENSSKTFYLVIAILIFFGIQLIIFLFCYWNTQRIKKRADMIRKKISMEYTKLREQQYNGSNQALRLNYYLVNPTDPNNRIWSGGNPINHLQPVGLSPGREQISSFSHYL